jgi:hypothetical protein
MHIAGEFNSKSYRPSHLWSENVYLLPRYSTEPQNQSSSGRPRTCLEHLVLKLSSRRCATLSVLGLSLLLPAIAATVVWLLPIQYVGDGRAALAARDYTSMWSAGHLATHGQLAALFDRGNYNAALRALFGSGLPTHVWSYPPPWLLIAAPVSTLPFFTGFLVWTCGTLCVLWIALRAGGLPASACAAVLCSPAAADNALAGQNGALTAALLLGGLLLADRRPVVAGAMFGALVFKPQLAFLLPICLLASGNWRALSAGAVVAGAGVLTSAMLFGSEAWVNFFTVTQPTLSAILREPWAGTPFQRIFASPLMAARSVGAGFPVAYAVQIALSLGCGVGVWRIWRRTRDDPVLRVALTSPLVLVASPWVHSYDMIPLATTVVILFVHAERKPVLLLLGFAWFWPGATVILSIPPTLEVASILLVEYFAILRLSNVYTRRSSSGGEAFKRGPGRAGTAGTGQATRVSL